MDVSELKIILAMVTADFRREPSAILKGTSQDWLSEIPGCAATSLEQQVELFHVAGLGCSQTKWELRSYVTLPAVFRIDASDMVDVGSSFDQSFHTR